MKQKLFDWLVLASCMFIVGGFLLATVSSIWITSLSLNLYFGGMLVMNVGLVGLVGAMYIHFKWDLKL